MYAFWSLFFISTNDSTCCSFNFTLPNLTTTLPKDQFRLTLIHFNDFHARFEETSPTSTRCREGDTDCIGGIARLLTAMNDLKARNPDSLVLNAGDTFQGTLWYYLYKWNVTQAFMNMLPVDVHTLGNHEFDDGIKNLVPYMKALKAPVVVANMNDTLEPRMKGLYKKSVVVTIHGRKIGIVGATIRSVKELSNVGNLTFTDETEAIKKEAATLKSQGVNIIIALTHCGIRCDKEIALNAGNDIDVVVGGHSHTLLYTGKPPGTQKPEGDYPSIVTNKSGKKVLVVQASSYTKFLGNLTVTFDANGEMIKAEGRPIYLENSIKKDPTMEEALKPYKKAIDKIGNVKVGKNEKQLSEKDCESKECNLGDFIADAMVKNLTGVAEKGYWTYAAVFIIAAGSIRDDIDEGEILMYDLITAQPFKNRLITYDLQGKVVRQALEYSVSDYDSRRKKGHLRSRSFLQVSGLHIMYNLSMPVGSRVQKVAIRCAKCAKPEYSPLEDKKTYRIASFDILADGGNGYEMVASNKKNVKVWGIDVDILTHYISEKKVINQSVDGRIVFK